MLYVLYPPKELSDSRIKSKDTIKLVIKVTEFLALIRKTFRVLTAILAKKYQKNFITFSFKTFYPILGYILLSESPSGEETLVIVFYTLKIVFVSIIYFYALN